jgi:hypothetical protein
VKVDGRPEEMTPELELKRIAEALQKVIEGSDSTYDWDDLMSVKCDDPQAEAVRILCWQVSEAFPGKGSLCNENGLAIFREILKVLQSATIG